MNFNTLFLIFIATCIVSCCKEEPIEEIVVLTDCVECVEYSYQQAYNDTFIVLTLEEDYYCVGDSGWLMPNGTEYWTAIDSLLINLMAESIYCDFLEDTIN